MTLEEFTRKIPPGWRPGIKSYPFRRYMEKLRLWWRFAEIREDQVGPLVAARLQGTPFDLAMTFELYRDGVKYTGADALALVNVDATVDVNGNTVAAQPAGVTIFIQQLIQEYEKHDQDRQTEKLDTFFDLRRGHLSLEQYCTEFKHCLHEAETLAGLQINNVCKTYLFLKWSGIAPKRVEDLKLQVCTRRLEQVHRHPQHYTTNRKSRR